ncbi:MAG: histidine kinase [Candidatus Cloacimonetes bacterium]|nr:histidine kinase [Candidatus Cloacimonadota bacterium]
MRIKHKFIALISLLHLIFLGLSLQLLKYSVWYFLLAEVVIIISIFLSISIYKQFVQPLNLISAGVESIKDKDFTMKFVKVGQFELDELIEVYNEMIERLREERLRQEEQHFFLERLVNSSPTGIIILNLDETVFSLNPAARRYLNITEDGLPELNLSKFPGQLPQAIACLQDGSSEIVNIHNRQAFRIQKAGFIDRGFHRYFVQIVELTKEILQAEREANEKVIRTISHEINNSIGAVNSILQSHLGMLSGEKEEMIRTLEIAMHRNEHLLHFMSNFVRVFRLDAPQKQEADLNQLLKAVQPLLAGSSKKMIDWQWQLSEKPVLIHIDVSQMEQVLLNILKNAVEALNKKGMIIIKTELSPQRGLHIFNDGQSLSGEVEKKLFSPFYSTKKNGQGIGLTLAAEILRNHGFDFGLQNTETGMVKFYIHFTD